MRPPTLLSSALFLLLPTSSLATLAPNNINPNPNLNPADLFTQQTSTSNHLNLVPRQGVAPAVNPAVAPPAATQMSPATTYSIHGPNGALMNIPYTQLFSATPDPWAAPTQGTIGLGSIMGTVGVVKTGTVRKRELSVETGVVARVRDGFASGFGVERRAVKGEAPGGIGVSSLVGIGSVMGFVVVLGAL